MNKILTVERVTQTRVLCNDSSQDNLIEVIEDLMQIVCYEHLSHYG